MRYEYPATKEELKARKYLEERGWSVDAPLCPDCNGSGYIKPHDAYWNPEHAGKIWPECPRGCETPMWFF